MSSGPSTRPALDRRLLLVAIAPVAAGILPSFLTGALAVQMRATLGFDEFGLGVAMGAFFGTGALGSVVFGRRADRLGAVRSLRAGATGSALVLLAMAAVVRSYTALVVVLALAGAANALSQPAANLFLARALPATRQGLAFGIKQSAIPLGSLLGGLAVPAVALTVGWRWAFAAGAVLATAAALVAHNGGMAARAGGSDRSLEGDRPGGDLVFLAVGIAFAAAAAAMLGAFLVSGAVETGLGEGSAGLLYAGCSLVSITMRLVLGARADSVEDRTGVTHLRTVARLLSVGALAFLLLATGVTPMYVLGAPLAFGFGWAWPGLFNLAVVTANPARPATATGMTQTGVYVGAVAGPLVFGAVASWSYRAAWLVGGACCAVAAVVTLTVIARIGGYGGGRDT